MHDTNILYGQNFAHSILINAFLQFALCGMNGIIRLISGSIRFLININKSIISLSVIKFLAANGYK